MEISRIQRISRVEADKRWWDINVPRFECPNPSMEAVYDYRWEVVYRHLRYASAKIGYVATEFCTMEDTWSGKYGAISCPAELQLNELRWLRDARYASDFLRYWLCEREGYAHNYSWSIGKAAQEVCCVLGDWRLPEEHLADLIWHQEQWDIGRVRYPNDRGYDPYRGLYWNTGRDSSGEFNLASCQLDEKLRGIEGYKIRGGAGYRPDVNANMYGNLQAIAHFAHRVGDTALEEHYQARADALRRRVLSELWDSRRSFFMHRWRYDEYAQDDVPGQKSIREYSFSWDTNCLNQGGTGFQQGQRGILHGRELSSYWLWQYDMIPVDSDIDYDVAWKALRDPAIFEAPYGPCSAEQADPWFSVIYGECRMNGDSWPLLTSRTLTALKHTLQTRSISHVSRRDFSELMDTYTRTQRKNGRPYCAESHDPYRPCWTVDREEGRHYFHSSYCDLIITGLAGIVPREDDVFQLHPLFPENWPYMALENLRYHGRDLSIYWDADGSRYGLGAGLTVLANSQVLLHLKDAWQTHYARLPDNTTALREVYLPDGLADLAVNNDSAAYPRVYASTEGNGLLSRIQNGRIWFQDGPANAWTSAGSANAEDSITLELAAPAAIREIRFCLYENADEEVALPEEVSFSIYCNSGWQPAIRFAQALCGRTVHRLHLNVNSVRKIRMNLRHKAGFQVGLIEWEVWGYIAKE